MLIRVADTSEDGIRGRTAADDILHIEVVVGVRRLEPAAAVVEVEVNGVDRCEGVVDAIEGILLIPLVVEDCELRRIKEATGVEAVDFNKVPPILAAECQ